MKEYFPYTKKYLIRRTLTIDGMIKRLKILKKHCKGGQWHLGLDENKEITAIGFNRACGIAYLEISKD